MKVHHLKTERAIREDNLQDADPIEIVKIFLDQMENEKIKPTGVVVICEGVNEDGESYLSYQSGGVKPKELRSLLYDTLAICTRNLL